VRHARRTVTRFHTHKTGALLAYLAHRRGCFHPREVLVEMFWPRRMRAA
jgi:DNA-binding SARP family transcriptional activator